MNILNKLTEIKSNLKPKVEEPENIRIEADEYILLDYHMFNDMDPYYHIVKPLRPVNTQSEYDRDLFKSQFTYNLQNEKVTLLGDESLTYFVRKLNAEETKEIIEIIELYYDKN